MTSRLPSRVTSLKPIESLWSQAPPIFLAPTLVHRPISTTASLAATIKQTRRRNLRDPYALRQAKARKDANLSRQAALGEQRRKELGDPIRGIPTPFVESFDTVVPKQEQLNANDISLDTLQINLEQSQEEDGSSNGHLNHGVNREELAKALEFSRFLTEPINISSQPGKEVPEHVRRAWEARDRNAAEAVRRIVNLSNGSSKHRTKKNIQRIVDTFGRHITDRTFKPKAPPANVSAQVMEPTPRAGPDTGSSEVQIGILTAKIRVLADRYEGENRNDKINKRNLRLLLHRRQKLLAYMERKERGSQRWFNMIETLGLTPACWKGQIAVE